MKARKQYVCTACGACIAPGDDYDRLWITSEEVQPFCISCKTAGLMCVPRDFLMWVGSESYPTIEHFVDEAKVLGVNKRVPAIAEGIMAGSRGFLIHDEGDPGRWGLKEGGIIFGCFVVAGIRYVVKPEDKLAWLEELRDKGIESILKGGQVDVPRLCGVLKAGAVYYYSVPDMEGMAELTKKMGAGRVEVEGGMITFKHPIPCSFKRFRGIKYLEPGMIPPLDDLGIVIHPWRNWNGYQIRVEGGYDAYRL